MRADVYSAPEALCGRTFDLVYTGIGALCWLPDIRQWGLSHDEFDERTAQALSARTRGELDRVMVDLPRTAAELPRSEVVEEVSGTAMAQRSAAAQWRRSMLAPWAVFAVFFILVWVATGAGYFWPMWPIMGWGIGVAVSGIAAHQRPETPQID